MSDQPSSPTPEPLDLSSLRLMPDWVANFDAKPAARTEYNEERPERGSRDRRDDRGGARRPGGPDRRSGGGGGGERRDDRGPPRRDGPGGGASAGGPRRFDRAGPGGPGGRRDDRRGPPIDNRPALPVGIKVTMEAEDAALDALAGHIKTSGRAFSLFDAARLVLAAPDRHRGKVECEPERLVGMYRVAADGALFESKEEATRYALRSNSALAALYKVEEVQIEPPAGNFSTIAVCGHSGEVLGPPSHHSYQTNLKRLHSERFGHLTLEDYKRSVKVENSEEILNRWKEQQSKATRWTSLTDAVEEGAEPVSFLSRNEFEAHFRRTHADTLITEVREAIVHGSAKREQFSPGIGRLLRRQLEDSRKHLFDLAQKLAHGLEHRGLKLFKRRGGKMFVSRVKPRAIATGVVLSDRIQSIVEGVKSEPGLSIGKLFAKIAPTPAGAEGEAAKTLTEAQKDVMRDMHWLAEEGYLIIYSDDVLFLGVQGDPPHHAEAKAAPAAVTNVEAEAPAPATEAAAEDEAAPVASSEEHPLPTPEEEAAAAEANEAAASDSDPGAAD